MSRPFSSFTLLSCVLLLACVVNRDHVAAQEQSGPPRPSPESPQQWVLLDDRPELWSSPGSEATGKRLEKQAAERIEIVGEAPGDGKAKAWLEVRTEKQSGWLPEALLAPPPQTIPPEKLNTIGEEPVNRFRGLAPDYVPPDLTPVHFGYEAGRSYLLRREAAQACEKMIRAARLDGVSIEIVSAYRSYSKQRLIYLDKLTRSNWLQDTVAKPGHSEHQLGTTVDLTGWEESVLLKPSFGDTTEGRWLAKHAPEYGFAVSYTEFNSPRTGYAPEPWHYRYFGTELAPRHHREALGAADGSARPVQTQPHPS